MEHQKDGVATGQCSHDIGIAHVIQRAKVARTAIPRWFQHHDVLGRLYADHASRKDVRSLSAKFSFIFCTDTA